MNSITKEDQQKFDLLSSATFVTYNETSKYDVENWANDTSRYYSCDEESQEAFECSNQEEFVEFLNWVIKNLEKVSQYFTNLSE